MASIIRNFARRSAGALALGLLMLTAVAAHAEDTSLFTSRVPPNVMLVIDTSGSMNIMMWHPAFDPTAVYDPVTCPNGYVPGDAVCTLHYLKYPLCNLTYGHGGFDLDGAGTDDRWRDTDITFRTLNGHSVTPSPMPAGCYTRDVFVDPDVQAAPPSGNQTRWQLSYLRWYFSRNMDVDHDGDGQTILQEILDTDNGSTSACLLAEPSPPPATFAKLKRARITAVQQVVRDVICETSKVADIRYGLAKFDPSTSEPPGGFVNVGIADYTTSHRTALITAIEALEGEQWTPLGETLFNVYRYFQSRAANMQAWGKNGTGTTRFPAYNINTGGTTGGTIPGQPVTHDCQKHFIVFLTDGEPTMDRFDNGSATLLGTTFANFDTNLIGHYNTPGDADEEPPNAFFAPGMDATSCGGAEACKVGLYLDDVAKFVHEKDFQLDAAFPSVQTIDLYTIGFTTTAGANTFLQRAADVGGGEFYSSDDPDDLTTAITNTINSIVAKSLAFTSAAVPASRTSSGDNFYSAYFLPIQGSAFWSGHLKNFDFTGAGEILTSDGKCAIGVDPTATPPCAPSGALRTSANGFWDVATAMPAPNSRKLYLELGATSFHAQPTTFTIPATPADAVPWFGIVAGDNTSWPYSGLSPNTTTDMASALIRYLRGCTFSNSATCTARVDGAGIPDYMGDIFHSNPVVVGSPNAGINEASYKLFANAYRQRSRVVYAGANDGFLHAFHAGNWDTSLTPDGHNRGTGQELMGFMPYGVRNTVKTFVKHNSGLRTSVLVDGSPVVADAWLYRNVSGSDLTTVNDTLLAKQQQQWRTVLIQGLRDGGQHYSALDITDPPASVSTGTTTYPRSLWAFPGESTSTVNGTTSTEGAFTGNTWSEPVITRVRVKADSATDATTYERWVAIFGGGYHTAGDPNGAAYKRPADAGYSAKGRAIYMVDLTTGKVLAKKYFDDAATALSSATAEQVGIKEMAYAIPSAPAVFDTDFDGFADVIYIGDLGGNLWKWVITASGDDPINNASFNDSLAQPNWPFRLFFRGSISSDPTTPDSSETLPGELTGSTWNAAIHYQSFFFPPTGALRKGKLVLAFGAGERADPIGPAADWNDGVASNNNHFYVVTDADPLEQVGTLPNRFTGRLNDNDNLENISTTSLTCAQMNSTTSGFYLTGRDAEKFVSNSTIFLGEVFTGSFFPSDPSATSACTSKGSAFLYRFDLDCGTGGFPSHPTDEDDRRIEIGDGLPTRPRVSVGDLNQGDPSGCVNKIVVVTSDGEIYNDCPGSIPSSGVKVRSWRER